MQQRKGGGGIFAWGNPEEFGDVSKNENDYIMVCRLLYTVHEHVLKNDLKRHYVHEHVHKNDPKEAYVHEHVLKMT